MVFCLPLILEHRIASGIHSSYTVPEFVGMLCKELSLWVYDSNYRKAFFCILSKPSDPSINLGGFESLVKVPTFL